MTTFTFTKQAERSFLKLPKDMQRRVLDKLRELKTHDDILSLLKRLTNVAPATHRMRIGTYRLILELESHEGKNLEFLVLDVGHRKDVYR